MVDTPRNDQANMHHIFRLDNVDQVEMVVADAKRGLDDPLSLTTLEVQRVCFALVAAYVDRLPDKTKSSC